MWKRGRPLCATLPCRTLTANNPGIEGVKDLDRLVDLPLKHHQHAVMAPDVAHDRIDRSAGLKILRRDLFMKLRKHADGDVLLVEDLTKICHCIEGAGA